MDEKKIEKIWKLSKESFQDEEKEEFLKKLSFFLNFDLRNKVVIEVIHYNQSNDLMNYYSYYRIFGEKGEYEYSLPFGRDQCLDLYCADFEALPSVITRTPRDPSKSSNGGDYYEGFRVYQLVHNNIELYTYQFSHALFSDFENECMDALKITKNYQEIAELDNSPLENLVSN